VVRKGPGLWWVRQWSVQGDGRRVQVGLLRARWCQAGLLQLDLRVRLRGSRIDNLRLDRTQRDRNRLRDGLSMDLLQPLRVRVSGPGSGHRVVGLRAVPNRCPTRWAVNSLPSLEGRARDS